MPTLSQLTLAEFSQNLQEASIQISQKIHLFLGGGTGIFLAAIAFLYSTTEPGEPDLDSVEVMNILTVVHFLFAIVATTNGNFISRRLLSACGKREYSVGNEGGQSSLYSAKISPTDQCVSVIRTATIIQLATMEGSAFFGLAVLILGLKNSLIYVEPLYLANGITTLAFLVYVAITFPSKERFEAIFKNRIQANI